MNASLLLIERAKAAKGLTSSYQLAHALNWSESTLSKLKSRGGSLSEEYISAICEFAGFDLETELARVRADSSTNPRVRAAYQKLAELAAREAA